MRPVGSTNDDVLPAEVPGLIVEVFGVYHHRNMSETLTAIILGFGADAADGISAGHAVRQDCSSSFQDAQGNPIPTLERRDVENHLRDIHGRTVCLKEK